MHVLIVGCGRVGSGLARDLVTPGFDVAIIDESPEAFHLLGDDFPGEFVVGRLMYSGGMSRLGGGNAWTVDYPRGDRLFAKLLRRLTTTSVRFGFITSSADVTSAGSTLSSTTSRGLAVEYGRCVGWGPRAPQSSAQAPSALPPMPTRQTVS